MPDGDDQSVGLIEACTAIDPFHEDQIRGAYRDLGFDDQQAAAKAARALLEGYGEDPKETEEQVFQVMLEFEQRFR